MSPTKAKRMDNGNGKEFWIALGKEMGETKACGVALNEKFDKFLHNDHVHLVSDVEKLDGKIDKLAIRIAYIVGGIMAIEFIVQIGVRLLAK